MSKEVASPLVPNNLNVSFLTARASALGMNDAQIITERRQKDRDAELQRLLDSCPDEVLLLLLQLLQEREKPASSRHP